MASKNYILLVVNPISGNFDKSQIIDAVSTTAQAKNLPLEIYETTGENDLASLMEIIEDRPPQRLLVAGGDGTISMAAETVLGKNICLGILPAGSANGLAVNFNIPNTLPEQVAIAFGAHTLKIDALFINNKLCLHIADLGMNAELIKNYENAGIRGKFGYFLQSFPTLFNSESPFNFRVETPDKVVLETGILLAIANAKKFGTGATINPDGKINDGKFEILIFKNLDFIEILKTINEQPDLSPDFVTVLSTHTARITTKSDVPFQIDGEFLGHTKLASCHIEKERLLLALPEVYCNIHSKHQPV